jgi:molybdopterin synthase sulfur carrier subunit
VRNSVKITFYGSLAKIAGEKIVETNAFTIDEATKQLSSKYGEQFSERIFDEKGNLRRFINIYVNGKDMRFLNLLNTKLNDGDNVAIIPAVGGG